MSPTVTIFVGRSLMAESPFKTNSWSQTGDQRTYTTCTPMYTNCTLNRTSREHACKIPNSIQQTWKRRPKLARRRWRWESWPRRGSQREEAWSRDDDRRREETETRTLEPRPTRKRTRWRSTKSDARPSCCALYGAYRTGMNCWVTRCRVVLLDVRNVMSGDERSGEMVDRWQRYDNGWYQVIVLQWA